jgi:hypothetical protein
MSFGARRVRYSQRKSKRSLRADRQWRPLSQDKDHTENTKTVTLSARGPWLVSR